MNRNRNQYVRAQGRPTQIDGAGSRYAISVGGASAFHLDPAIPLTERQIQLLIETLLLPSFHDSEDTWILTGDLNILLRLFGQHRDMFKAGAYSGTLFDDGPQSVITLGANTELDLSGWVSSDDPAVYAAVRNLALQAAAEASAYELARQRTSYFSPLLLTTSSPEVMAIADKQLDSARLVNTCRTSEFANSAYYMGSKKHLCGFLMESFRSVATEESVVLDLMCGSGVVSGSSARFWPTVASDAQAFSRILAEVQGGGFSRLEAESILHAVTPPARQHATDLKAMIAEHLDLEDNLLHGDAREELASQYIEFHRSFPLYPAEGSGPWQPRREVELRRRQVSAYPYLLFTAYFANSYLGLRQAVELDSLRYAIDCLRNPLHKRWALGALVATVSRLGTTYGGHFAQPLTANLDCLRHDDVAYLIEQRRYSIFHEFSIRLRNLAEASETVQYPVQTVSGPWQESLTEATRIIAGRTALVYVDPPYRREEYSRYYHLLETLIDYSYPSLVGKGRVPDKRRGERFGSEFSTRDKMKMARHLATVIAAVLERGWICAWSYADSSDANIRDVLDLVIPSSRADMWSFAAPYAHHSQGGKKPKPVIEHLLFFRPKA